MPRMQILSSSELIAFNTPPQSWAHINMLGEYDFSDKKLADSFDILPLKSGRHWGNKKHQISQAFKGLAEILCRILYLCGDGPTLMKTPREKQKMKKSRPTNSNAWLTPYASPLNLYKVELRRLLG